MRTRAVRKGNDGFVLNLGVKAVKNGFSVTHLYGLTESYGPAVVNEWKLDWRDLEPPDAVLMLRELARIARRGIIVNDLAQRPITLVGGVLLSRLLTRNRYSRHDAPPAPQTYHGAPDLRWLRTAAPAVTQ
jgi:hypothetical protein